MKPIIALSLILVATVCQNSRAQDSSTLNLFLGYSYTRVNPSATLALPSYSSQGGEASISLKVFRRIAAVADFRLGATSLRNSNIVGLQIHGTQVSYLFGPRVTLPTWKRITPFGEALLGFSHAQAGLYITNNSQMTFAWAAGGGLDYRLNGFVSLRPIQLEYMQTRFNEWTYGQQYQNDLRASAGFVFHF